MSREGSLEGERVFLAPNVADDDPIDEARVLTPSPSSLPLLLNDEALMEEAARFSAGKSSIPNRPRGEGLFPQRSLCPLARDVLWGGLIV